MRHPHLQGAGIYPESPARSNPKVGGCHLRRITPTPTSALESLMRTNNVKKLLKAGKPTVGTWLSLGNITAARFMARAGFDWLTVDVEHSLVNVETTTHMIASIADAGCVPLARVPSNRHDHIKRVLDNGGFGVVVPMVT